MGLGSVKGLTDATGNVTDTWAYDAFGHIENRSGPTANPYRYTGEYFDDTTGHIYLRDRWLDPSMGRFVSQDSFDGKPNRPITINKYAYADADPVNKTDPSGMMSLGETMSAINTMSTLSNIATSSYDFVFGRPDLEQVDGQASPWDNLMAMVIRTVAESLSSGMAGGAAFGAITSYSGTGPKHHTIPEYMCGAANQDLVALPYAVHKRLHDELYLFELGVRVGSATFNLFFRKKKPSDILKSPIAQAARTPTGRVAIGIGLGLYYQYGDYMGLGHGKIKGDTLGTVFAREVAMFSGMKHSYPTCKKK